MLIEEIKEFDADVSIFSSNRVRLKPKKPFLETKGERYRFQILCLQEIDSSLVNSFYNYNLNLLGYQGIYKQRTNEKVDGCAIYYKRDKFNLVKYMTVELFKRSVHLLGE